MGLCMLRTAQKRTFCHFPAFAERQRQRMISAFGGAVRRCCFVIGIVAHLQFS
jgi:hypothetical protein